MLFSSRVLGECSSAPICGGAFCSGSNSSSSSLQARMQLCKMQFSSRHTTLVFLLGSYGIPSIEAFLGSNHQKDLYALIYMRPPHEVNVAKGIALLLPPPKDVS
jgi:hypothetical protein